MRFTRAVALAVVCAAPGAFAGTIYTVGVLQTPTGTPGVLSLSGIDNLGQAAGSLVITSGSGGILSFLSTTTGFQTIAPPTGFSEVIAGAINELGTVAGTGFTNGAYAILPFAGTPAGSSALPAPPGPPFAGSSAAGVAGINDSGEVVGGASYNGGPNLAFVSAPSGSSDIPLPAGYSQSIGEGINNFGVIVGIAFNQSPADGAFFIDTTLGVSLVSLPAGWEPSFAQIGDLGQIVGTAFNSAGVFQAFEGTSLGLTPIPLPAGATTAFDSGTYVNSSGVVVGTSDAGGWIWDAADGTQLLNTLVPAGWNITGTGAISNNGFILAQGSFDNGPSQYVELTPQQSPPPPQAPEPPPCLLAAAGIVLLIGARYRWFMFSRYAATVVFLASCLTTPAQASNISWVGIVNGSGEGGTGGFFGSSGGNGQSCSTYGPGFGEPSSFFGTIVGIPLGGIQPCGYFGGSLVGSGALVSASISAQINNGGSSSGSASASASGLTLQADASQTLANQASSPTTIFQSAGASLIDDPNWVVTVPGMTTGTPLIPTYTWSITLNEGTPYLSGGANVSLGQADFDVLMQEIGSDSNAVAAFGVRVTYNQNSISCYYNSNPLNSCAAIGLTTGTGTIQGTATVTYTPPSYFPEGVSVEEELGTQAIATDNAYVDPSATLVGVSFAQNTVFGPVPVTSFTLTTSAGTFTQSGFTPNVPEPAAGLLAALGIVGIAAAGRLHRRRSPSI